MLVKIKRFDFTEYIQVNVDKVLNTIKKKIFGNAHKSGITGC